MDTQKPIFEGKLDGLTSHYCSILGVALDASEQQISESYYRMKKAYGDSGRATYSLVDSEEAQSCLEEVEQAYRALIQMARRKKSEEFCSANTKPYLDSSVESAPMGGASANSLTDCDGHLAMLGVSSSDDIFSTAGELNGASKLPRNLFALTTENPELKKEAESILFDHEDQIDGQVLKKIRILFEVSEDELGDHVKISIGHIRALEENQFDLLPPLVYTKGFLSSYLRYLAIPNPDRVIVPYLNNMRKWQETSEK